jgi:hypothetical protein
VPWLNAQSLNIGNIGANGLGHPQPIERQQGDQRMLGGRPDPGGDQQRARLVAIQAGSVHIPGT